MVRPHQVLHHHKLPTSSSTKFRSSWFSPGAWVKVATVAAGHWRLNWNMYGWMQRQCLNSKLPALPFEASKGASIQIHLKYVTAQLKLLAYIPSTQRKVKSYWLPQHERTWCRCGSQCAIQPSAQQHHAQELFQSGPLPFDMSHTIYDFLQLQS